MERTLALVAIPSESREEAAILVHLREEMGGVDLELVDVDDSVASSCRASGVPERPSCCSRAMSTRCPRVGAAAPGPRRRRARWTGGGRHERRARRDDRDRRSDRGRRQARTWTSATCSSVARSFRAAHSALAAAVRSVPRLRPPPTSRSCMEPTENAIEVGCLGNLNVVVTVRGTAAHSARPWLGDNAIHRAISALGGLAELPVRDVEIDGLVYREVMSVTASAGGVATNVRARSRRGERQLPVCPDRTPEEAETRLRELLAGHQVEVEVVGNAPPGPVTVVRTTPGRSGCATGGGLSVGPKQAWTPVAEFAAAGVDAVNFGPGDPQYAHRDDERLDAGALVRCVRGADGVPGAGSGPDARRDAGGVDGAPFSGAPGGGALSVRGARRPEGRGAGGGARR